MCFFSLSLGKGETYLLLPHMFCFSHWDKTLPILQDTTSVILHSPKYLILNSHWGSHPGWAAHRGHLHHPSTQVASSTSAIAMPVTTTGTATPTCLSKAPGDRHMHRVKLHHAQGSHRPSEQSCFKKNAGDTALHRYEAGSTLLG